MFFSICRGKKNAEAIEFLGLIKNMFPQIKKKLVFQKINVLLNKFFFVFYMIFKLDCITDHLLYYPQMSIFSFHTFVILLYKFARNGT